MLSPWAGSSARISAGSSVSHLPEATAGALLSLQPTLYSQALSAQGSCCKLCSSQFSFPLRTINYYLSSAWTLDSYVSWKIGGCFTVLFLVWAHNCRLLSCEILELSKYQGEEIWGPATLQLCHSSPMSLSFCPPAAYSQPCCIRNWQETSRDSLKASAHIWKRHAFLKLYSLRSLLFGWSLMPYMYYFCNQSNFSKCS